MTESGTIYSINSSIMIISSVFFFFVPQLKERRHDIPEYFLILILVDLLFHFKYSLLLVLWHDILLLFFLPSEFPLLILLPLLGLSPKLGSLSSYFALRHVNDSWDSRDKHCVLMNPRWMLSAHIPLWAPDPWIQLPACHLFLNWLRWSLCHLEEWELKTEIKVLGCKVLLARGESVPTLLAVSDLFYVFQFFDFTNPSHPLTHPN